MRIQLSSTSTLAHLYLGRPLLVTACGIEAVRQWSMYRQDPQALYENWVTLALWLGFTIVFFRSTRGIQTVWLDGECLMVESRGTSRRIPLTAITHVREESWFTNPKQIRLTVSGGAETDKVVFLARSFFRGLAVHPTTVMLREEIATAQASAA